MTLQPFDALADGVLFRHPEDGMMHVFRKQHGKEWFTQSIAGDLEAE
eukprot:gene9074-1629_t